MTINQYLRQSVSSAISIFGRQADRKHQSLNCTRDLGAMAASGHILHQDNATNGKSPPRAIAGRHLVLALNGHQNLSAWSWMCGIAFPVRGRPQPVASVRWNEPCEVQRFRRRSCEARDQFDTQILESGYALLVGV
jgi:hypothetical protein